MSNSNTLISRWWYGNALAVLLWAIGMGFALINMAMDGAAIPAIGTVAFLFASLGVGYLSVFTFYIDVRKIRNSQIEYNPAAWLYVIAWFLLSPILPSAVYLYNRHKHIGTP